MSCNQVHSQSLEELERKIKASGMSEAEIQAKASAAGYTMEDYNKLSSASAKKEDANKSAVTQEKVIVTPPSSTRGTPSNVPEFLGREGAENLSPFGYNVFNYTANSFEPSLNVPVPTNYVIGPGDEIIVTLWGETQLVHNVTVSKNGDILVPNVGLVNVNGITLKDLRAKLFSSLAGVYSSLKSSDVGVKTRLDVTTGKLRSVKVYVLGEVNTPGGYSLPALSTSFTALYYSGGPTVNGSLRNVNVMRAGKMIGSVDLYEYLITGSKTNDVKLEDEDIVFIPPAGKRVALAGNAFRPAIYELKENEVFSDLINYSGGLKFTAYYDRVHVERIIPFADRKNYENNILSIDLKFQSSEELKNSSFRLENGDVISVLGVNSLPENRVNITGFVKKPGVYELSNHGMRISDLIIRADSLAKNAFVENGLLVRTLPNEKKEIIRFNVELALKHEASNDIVLKNRDEIRIFDEEMYRPTKSVEIAGEVRTPGLYNRSENLTLSELITLAGGLTEKATTENIEITSLDSSRIDVFSEKNEVSLPAQYWTAEPSKDVILRDYDRVVVKADPRKTFNINVGVTGEVLFPGNYSILREEEKLYDFIKRSGGFKPTAYKAAIHIERNLRLLERSYISIPDTLLYKNKSVSLFNPSLVADFSNRIPIDWEKVENDPNSLHNIVLWPGDRIVVPRDPDVVFVLGDVGIPCSVPYKKGMDVTYYIEQAGGYKETSAQGDEIVILPNGRKWKSSGFFLIPDENILSGSTIIVPTLIDNENTDTWSYVRDTFTILSSAAVVVISIINIAK